MTSIQRQYSLPNCTLALNGFSDASAGATESRPLMTTLLSAKCQIIGQELPLQGGREFLESLIRATHMYVQSVLSGVQLQPQKNQVQIQIQNAGLNQHRILLHSASEPNQSESSQEMILSSVQLFDLVEAVDQLLADPQTLPDLTLPLTPISKRQIRAKHALSEQVVPATVGLVSVAVAAIALSTLPAPEIERPSDTLLTAPTPESTESPASPPATSTEPTPITDPEQLADLQQRVFDSLDKAWTESIGIPSDSVIYRVTVDSDARILGYIPQDDLAREEINATPLLELLQLSKVGGSLTPDATAQFEVIFNPNGTLDVQPWQDQDSVAPPPPESAQEN